MLYADKAIQIANSRFENNSVDNKEGCLVYAKDDAVTVTNSEFIRNHGWRGVCSVNSSTLISESLFEDNDYFSKITII